MAANPGLTKKCFDNKCSKKSPSKNFGPGPRCKVGCVWVGRDARGLAEVWMQLQIQLLQAAWWDEEQGQLETLAPGYDVLLDCHMRPHLLEVNSRPSIYTEPLDLAVNAPLVRELFSLVGFHLPSCGMSQSTLKVAMLREEIEPFISKYTGVVQEIQNQPGDGSAVNVFWRIVHTRSLQRGESQKNIMIKGETRTWRSSGVTPRWKIAKIGSSTLWKKYFCQQIFAVS